MVPVSADFSFLGPLRSAPDPREEVKQIGHGASSQAGDNGHPFVNRVTGHSGKGSSKYKGAMDEDGKSVRCDPKGTSLHDSAKSRARNKRASAEPTHAQPADTRSITKEQLINEVKGIYAGLVMVEKKCVEIDQQQSSMTNKLSDEQWQALTALHRTLLHEHHDFFLASQHPSLSPALRRLATKYAMPARMWRHGIHSYLGLVQLRLPDLVDQMITFIYHALLCLGTAYAMPVQQWPASMYKLFEKPPKKATQGVVSQAPHLSPYNVVKVSDPAMNYSKLCSRKYLAMWKWKFGRNKEWRCCRFVKMDKRILTCKLPFKRDWLNKTSSKHSPLAVPVNVFRRSRGSHLRLQSRPRKVVNKSGTSAFHDFDHHTLLADYDNATEDVSVEHSSGASALASFSVPIPVLPETNQGLFNPLHAILPYENFIGSVLGRSFRISRFIRSETHGNVYAVEGLSPAAFAYQARAYTLRGMPPKIREYRVRNLKKFASKPSFVCSFDQHGKKFVINLVGETKEQFFTTAQSKGTKACEFGTAQQKHTPDYDEAFPKLQVTSKALGAELSFHSETENLVVTNQPYLSKQQGTYRAPMITSEATTLLFQSYAAVVQNGNTRGTPPEKVVVDEVKQDKGETTRKAKTPQQMERDRVKQRLRRTRKRALKKMGSVVD